MQERLDQSGNKGLCAEFEARLTELLDGALAGAELERFGGHAKACADCGPLYRQARLGMAAVRALEAVEPPANLVRNILAQTSMRAEDAAAEPARTGWMRRLADKASPRLVPGLAAMMTGMRTQRFAMTAAAAFFSVTVVLSAAGISVGDLRHLDLRPSAIKQTVALQYYETSARVVKYYENIRLVYALDVLREDEAESAEKTPKGKDGKSKSRKDRKNEDNEGTQQQNQNFSRREGHTMLAKLLEEDRENPNDRRMQPWRTA